MTNYFFIRHTAAGSPVSGSIIRRSRPGAFVGGNQT